MQSSKASLTALLFAISSHLFTHIVLPALTHSASFSYAVFAERHTLSPTEDFICNWLGNYRWVNALPWSGAADFKEAEFEEWETKNGTLAGTVKASGGLSFVKVKAAVSLSPSLCAPGF